ncbi:4-alpha-glucanotransferase [Larsenimonas salina]|uniref:4-alpha-glucanotransferase n=1 Tax=Larsenimonas salina TaxID=1295565 RepID=UPI0020737D3E|nr:4-alpha-glucanotransferase [Larsenimonas salina]MCM5703867.1 4-alpha-glucanotransferase [Larsenimonas salina]
MTASLETLAELAGIQRHWENNDGEQCTLDDKAICRVLAALGYPADSQRERDYSHEALLRLVEPKSVEQWPPLITAEVSVPVELPSAVTPGTAYRLESEEESFELSGETDDNGFLAPVDTPGYYRLTLAGKTVRLAVAPTSAPRIPEGTHLAGLGVQLYSLRRAAPTALGDLDALSSLARDMGEAGLDALAISPVHALFEQDPTRYSPYAPSSRLALNSWYALPLGTQAPDEPLIDYQQVAKRAQTLLDRAHLDMSAHERREFEAFCSEAPKPLLDHACFEALCDMFGPFEDWPVDYKSVNSEAVRAFERDERGRIERYLYAQWLARRGLMAAQTTAQDAGMRVGLIADIAVGVAADGSQVWSRPNEVLGRLSVGSPPDAFNADGQSWGVTGFSPQGLVETGFSGFIDMLRATLGWAGGLRIDHIMGLSRLWLIPENGSPLNGAYVRYPEQALLRLVALEAWRHDAVVIGEDLGTVEDGFRDRLGARNILGMAVMWFERDGDAFLESTRYAPQSVAMSSTHDLPTVAGWLSARDIEWRESIGAITAEDARSARDERAEDRVHLAEALGIDASASVDHWLDAAARFVGKSPGPLAILPLEDILALEEQPNLPGTVDTHPNWRRRLPLTVDALARDPGVIRRLKAFLEGRRAATKEHLND